MIRTLVSSLIEGLEPRFVRDFRRQMRDRKFEISPEGLYFPQAKAVMIGEVEAWLGSGERRQTCFNSWTLEGFTHMLATEIGDGAKVSTWYLAPFSGNVAVSENATAATFASTYTELTNTYYSESTRIAYVEGTPASGQVDNYSSPAVITAATANVTVAGFGMLSVSTKGSASGTLLALHKYSTAYVIPESGGTLGLKYRLKLQNTA